MQLLSKALKWSDSPGAADSVGRDFSCTMESMSHVVHMCVILSN